MHALIAERMRRMHRMQTPATKSPLGYTAYPRMRAQRRGARLPQVAEAGERTSSADAFAQCSAGGAKMSPALWTTASARRTRTASSESCRITKPDSGRGLGAGRASVGSQHRERPPRQRTICGIPSPWCFVHLPPCSALVLCPRPCLNIDSHTVTHNFSQASTPRLPLPTPPTKTFQVVPAANFGVNHHERPVHLPRFVRARVRGATPPHTHAPRTHTHTRPARGPRVKRCVNQIVPRRQSSQAGAPPCARVRRRVFSRSAGGEIQGAHTFAL